MVIKLTCLGSIRVGLQEWLFSVLSSPFIKFIITVHVFI